MGWGCDYCCNSEVVWWMMKRREREEEKRGRRRRGLGSSQTGTLPEWLAVMETDLEGYLLVDGVASLVNIDAEGLSAIGGDEERFRSGKFVLGKIQR